MTLLSVGHRGQLTTTKLHATQVSAGWLALAGSFGAYVILSQLSRQPFHVGRRALRFFDLRVYRGAAQRMLTGNGHLYAHPILQHLGFTYPPAAALLLMPLTLVSLQFDKFAVTGLNVMALVWILNSTLVFANLGVSTGERWSLAALLAAAVLWLEPVTVTLGYGQIDLLIAGLVMFDLSRPERARFTGIAIGIAAGIKLTPLLFIVYLLLSGRRRAAATAAGAFLATVAVSFAIAGRSAIHYWGKLIFETSRVGAAGDTANQSLRGALARLLSTPHPGLGVEAVVVVVAMIGLFLAVAAARRGQPRLGYGLAAVTTLLTSPVSWTHHWCLAIPALVLLGVTAIRERSRTKAAAATLIAAMGYGYLPERFMGRRDYLISGLGSIPADPYVLIGLAVLAAAAVYQYRRRRQPTVVPVAGSGVPGTVVTAAGGSSRFGAGGS